MGVDDREILTRIWWAGVRAVRGFDCVNTALNGDPIPRPDAIVAVGKAAASMASAAVARYGSEVPCLVITKYDHAAEANLPTDVEVIEAAHPVPDSRSLAGGRRLLDFVSETNANAHLLFLVSGGASALVEVPKPGLTLDDLAAENARLLAAGLDIHAMNARRRELSQIKGGGLLSAFPGRRVTVLAISDVEGDDIAVIGSGIGAAPAEPGFRYDLRLVATNAIARAAAGREAEDLGISVISSEETLYADVAVAATRIADTLDGKPGLRIWGGEPTTVLPPDPGRGGRNQALALSLAEHIAGRKGLTVLVGGTDGSDGPTTAAGGIVDGATWDSSGRDALDRADSGSWLANRGVLFETGPTGTNVMDLAFALQR